MALISQEFKNKIVELLIVEPEDGEFFDDWRIITIEDIDTMKKFTPDELIELGQFLISTAENVKANFTKKGKRKKK